MTDHLDDFERDSRPVALPTAREDGETDAADLLYDAWVLIANARDWHGGDESAEWRQAAIRWRTEWEDADAKRITAEAELAAERAKAERVEALCDEYRTNCDPDTKQAQVAEIFRVALTGGEQ